MIKASKHSTDILLTPQMMFWWLTMSLTNRKLDIFMSLNLELFM